MKGLSAAMAMALSIGSADALERSRSSGKMRAREFANITSGQPRHRANKHTKKARKAQKNARRMNRSGKR